MTATEEPTAGDDRSWEASLDDLPIQPAQPAPTHDPTEAQGPAEEPENEELGLVGRVLAVPLVPFVAVWEGTKAGVRGTAAAVRSLARALKRLRAPLGRVARATVRCLSWPLRVGYRVLAWAATRIASGAGWLWARGVALVGRIAARLMTAVRAVLRPARVIGGAIVAVLRRIVVALRACARAVAAPIRALARVTVALLRRWLVAARAATRTLASGGRVAGRAILALLRRIGIALRSAARTAATPIRGLGRACRAFVRRCLVALRMFAPIIASGLRAAGCPALAMIRMVVLAFRVVVRGALFPLRAALRIARPVAVRLLSFFQEAASRAARVLALVWVGLRAASRMALRPVRWSARLITNGARRAASVVATGIRRAAQMVTYGTKTVGRGALRLVRRLLRPATAAAAYAHARLRAAARILRSTTKAVGSRVRRSSNVVSSKITAQWKRSRMAPHRIRVAVRQAVKDARVSARRWAHQIRRHRPGEKG